MPMKPSALIVGAGDGLSASLARVLSREGGYRIALAARNPGKLVPLTQALEAMALACDASDPIQVDALFAQLDQALRAPPDVVIYNPAARVRGPITEVDAQSVAQALAVTAYGGFLVAQQAARRMLPRGQGALLFTGASASVKGYAHSAAFAMGKFALRGLAQSLARELAPQGIHVARIVVDGVIRNPGREEPGGAPDSMLDPDAIARSYLQLLRQDRSAWSSELELRPWVERF
ncbi:MAG: SDR family NAD(P)-dependent oxidoreductase [Betaproteobacteria bacterium]|nr:SDR family NAD(P)-dependent oxidoreductase [Betaproteobacteria bacterium]MDE2123193.1 SDR family NAD(P)-dependent oxidoreductase [Betaproteobacteria bacterium]MDE2187566.1 SDR family NAD(P)-dependent oxidoreductase [Betaproteobacteria bacterium]MDE2323558.1 SDR family NAD(P)-dependent oxidoreductase [Betaproteobacteria bacterium]